MARILMIVAPRNFRDEEYFKSKQVLESAGHLVTTGSTIADEIRSAEGKTIQSTVRVTEIEIFDFDAVLFVGGPGMVELVASPDMKNLAQRFFRAKKLVAAICVAPAILANAGLLKSKRATSWDGVRQTLGKGGANYTGNPIETDGNIITANGPDAADELGEAIVDYLKTSSIQPSL